MTQLHYCNTLYEYQPPIDINPLLLELYKDKKVLALCARDKMIERITARQQNVVSLFYPNQKLLPMGWWETYDLGLVNSGGSIDVGFLFGFDAGDYYWTR